MKTSLRPSAFAVVAILFLAVLVSSPSAAQPETGRFQFDFNSTNLPPGVSVLNDAYIGDDGSGVNGCLHLTDAVPSRFGHFKISNLGEGMNVTRIQIQWRSLVGAGGGADGYSMNWATDLPKTPTYANPGENGAGSGVSVTVDTFDNGDSDLVGLEIRWKTNVVTSLAVSSGVLRPNAFVNVSFTVDEDGQATLNYDSFTLTAQLTGWAGIAKGDLIFGARTGAVEDRHWIDDLEISARGVTPGTYTGLFRDFGNWQHTNSGSVNLKVTPRGTYSGALMIGTTKIPFTGQFDLFDYTSRTQVTLPGGLPATIDLSFDNTDNIDGFISNAVWQASLSVTRLVWDKKRRPATNHVGQYVFVVDNNDMAGSSGFGYGTLTVDAAGGVKFAGVLGDGSKVTQKTFLGRNGAWAIYLPTHGGKGSFQGWLPVNNLNPTDDELGWFKLPGVPGPIYPAGFTVYPDTYLAPYTPPAPGERIFPYFVGQAEFTYDGDDLTTFFGLTINNQFIDLGTNGLSIKFAPKTGLFTGTILVNGIKVKFGGVVFPPEGVGVGHFLGSDQTGSVVLQSIDDP